MNILMSSRTKSFFEKAVASMVIFTMLFGSGLFINVNEAQAIAVGNVDICHFPPGNPENVAIQSVGAAAVGTHIGVHEGDFIIENAEDEALCNAIIAGDFQCSDGIDNDSDGLSDFDDPGCSGPTDNDESDDQTPELATLTLVKEVEGSDASPSLWTLEATGTDGFSGTTGVSEDVEIGSYDLSEDGPSGYTASAWACEGTGDFTQDDDDTVTLDDGADVTCTITNTYDDQPEKTYETIVVTGDTSAGENQPGWLFNRDPSTQTEFEFNTDEMVIGDGALYVLPIDGNINGNSDKFIGEYFMGSEIADLEGISYDFLMGSGSEAGDYVHFYMNVYANFGESSPTKFYDCRYNIVPTTGSTGSWTTVDFDPTQTYPVTTRTGGDPSPYTCPSSPADMDSLSPGSVIRVIALNVGDTSANDDGLDGYYDNVIVDTVTKQTTFDFEPLDDNNGPMCEEGAQWADELISFSQGTTKIGGAVAENRSDATKALGEAEDNGAIGTFVSLGVSGSIVVKFDAYITDEAGDDISIHETTNGTYPAETALIEVSQNGVDFEEVGTADNVGVSYFDINGTGFPWIQYVRITDTTDYSLHTNNADGFDLDAVDATYGVCDEPICEEDSFVIESDSDTGLFAGGFASVLSFIHDAWTASIPGAQWVWSVDGVNDPTTDEYETFVEEFWVGDTVHEAILDVAGDNSYTVWINGVEVAAIADENNFQNGTQDQYDVTANLLVGQVNELKIEVKNWGVNGASPTSNPAGLMYRLDVTAGSCDGVDEEPTEPVESMIIQPEVNEITSGTTELEAFYADENGDGNDGVQWAVRAGTCAAGTNTVLGNVDGHNDPFTWNGIDFLADFDTTLVPNGEYCFVFNPTEDAGDANQRLTRTFFVENPTDGGGDDDVAFQCELGILHMNIVAGSPKTRLSSIDEDILATAGIANYDADHSNNLAVNADGVVYSIDKDTKELFILNSDGSRSLVGDTGFNGADVLPASGFGPDGVLYVLEKNEDELYGVNPATGEATLLHELDDIGVNGGDLVVNEYYQLIYVQVDGSVYLIDLFDDYNEYALGNLPEGLTYTGLALIDGVYYATESEEDGLHEFTLGEGIVYGGVEYFEKYNVYAGDAASCPSVSDEARNYLGGYKFYDNEPPVGEFAPLTETTIENWPIFLYDADWQLLDSTVTNEDGEYRFENLAEDIYYVCEADSIEDENDWFQTFPTEGTDGYAGNDSEADDQAEGCYRVEFGADDEIDDLAFGNAYEITGGGSSSGGGGGGRSRRAGGSDDDDGEVLGASTGPQCTLWLDTYIFGRENTNASTLTIMKLQLFLNQFEGENLTVNGVYDQATEDAVVRFQLKYRSSTLGPWGLLLPTGRTWFSTTYWINMLVNGCGGPLHDLVPFSQYTGDFQVQQ